MSGIYVTILRNLQKLFYQKNGGLESCHLLKFVTTSGFK